MFRYIFYSKGMLYQSNGKKSMKKTEIMFMRKGVLSKNSSTENHKVEKKRKQATA